MKTLKIRVEELNVIPNDDIFWFIANSVENVQKINTLSDDPRFEKVNAKCIFVHNYQKYISFKKILQKKYCGCCFYFPVFLFEMKKKILFYLMSDLDDLNDSDDTENDNEWSLDDFFSENKTEKVENVN